MKIVIIGTGPVGLFFAWLFTEHGHNISLFSRSHCKLWETNGIRMINKTTDDTYENVIPGKSFSCISTYKSIEQYSPDIIFLATKSSANKEVCDNISSVSLPEGCRLIIAQNGLHNESQFLHVFKQEYISRIVVTVATEMIDDSTFVVTKLITPLYIGSVNGTDDKLLTVFIDTFNSKKVLFAMTKSIQKEIWKKAAINCAINPLSAILQKPMNEIIANPLFEEIIFILIDEVISVSKEEGIIFTQEEVTKIKQIPRLLGGHKTSMSKNIEHHRITEIDSLNDVIVSLGQKHDIPTPLNTCMSKLIHDMEHTVKPLYGGFIKDSCRNDNSIVKNMVQKSIIVKRVKTMLSSLLVKLVDLGIPAKNFLNDDINEMGNIGVDHPNEKLEYLKSSRATIREKIHAITNCIFDSKSNTPNRATGVMLLRYLFKSKIPYALERKRFILGLFNEKISVDIFTKKYGILWSPITIKYPEFIFKRFNLSKIKWDRNVSCNVIESELLEPLSEYERKFIGSDKHLPYITGECYYRAHLYMDPISKQRKKEGICAVAGLSGHSLLLLELAMLFGFSWKLMMYALLITLVPHHHSIDEIIDAVKVLGIVDKRESSVRLLNKLSIPSQQKTRKQRKKIYNV